MKKLIWIALLLLSGCFANKEYPEVTAGVEAESDALYKEEAKPELQADFTLPDLGEVYVIDLTGYTPCGVNAYCLPNQVCVDGKICCPLSKQQVCGGACFPVDCECVEDGDVLLCLPADMHYCGKGISCWQEEICQPDGDTYYCIPQDTVYCGDGRWCAKTKICTETKCCPPEQPIECGLTCCWPDETCIDSESGTCLPKWASWCQGIVCSAGEKCADDGTATCFAEDGDYCGNGQSCPPGSVCASNGGCCPFSQPQWCGKECCPGYYDCVNTVDGKKCIPPGTVPCGETWCAPAEYCADAGTSLCLKDGAQLCTDGHICDVGLWCAGQTCCTAYNAKKDCGALCCPNNWQCINAGEACIPPGATYLGKGKYCVSGTFFNSQNEHCDPVGWQPCGAGTACPPGKKCAKNEHGQQCCPADQMTLCGGNCCSSGFTCVHDGNKDVCIPPGAVYCWGKSEQEWCPFGAKCGKKKCLPSGADECEDGDFCPNGMKCTESKPACCPVAASGTCGQQCCKPGYKCTEINGEKQCLPSNAVICQDTIVGDTVCYNGEVCAVDGACLNKKYLSGDYVYCGGGQVCDKNLDCGGLCEDFCCVSDEYNDIDEFIQEVKDCFSGTLVKNCAELGDQVECCSHTLISSPSFDLEKLQTDFKSKCTKAYSLSLSCDLKPAGQNEKLCCQMDRPKTVKCLVGCASFGKVCQEIPTSNSGKAYLYPVEAPIFPNEVEVEVGEYCSSVDFMEWLLQILSFGFVDFNIVFEPAGFADNYRDGVYHAENDVSNWFNRDNSNLAYKTVAEDEVLVVEAAWIIDNMEGIDCPHGPYGQYYWLIHKKSALPSKLNKLYLKNFESNSLYGKGKFVLRGPLAGGSCWQFCFCYGLTWLGLCYTDCVSSFGKFNTDVNEEWVDNTFMRYTPGRAGLYKWQGKESEIYLTLRESDGAPDFGRKDEYSGFALISRKATKTACGIWTPLYKYENTQEDADPGNDQDDYYYKTGKIAAFLLLRTIKCTGKPEDPC